MSASSSGSASEGAIPCGAPGHILVEPYCVFCRVTLLNEHHDYILATALIESWRTEVFCFFNIPVTSQDPSIRGRSHIFRADLKYSWWIKGSDTTYEILADANLRLCCRYNCSRCDDNITANLVHASCLQLAAKKLPTVSPSFLCKVAQKLRPIMRWPRAVRILELKPNNTAHFKAPAMPSGTDLEVLVTRIQNNFPLEMQELIFSRLSPSLYYSLGCCSETIDSSIFCVGLLQDLEAGLPVPGRFPLSNSLSTGEFLYARLVRILGDEWCLAEVGTSLHTDTCITLGDAGFHEIQYGIGCYGVTRLRLHYNDRSWSPWLGRSSAQWVTTIQADDIQRVHTVTDGFKLLSICYGVENEQTLDQTRMLWDQEPAPESRCSLINVNNSRSSIRGNPDKRLAQTLYFNLKENEHNSLTIYGSLTGVSSIQINDDAQSRLGRVCPRSCAVTFFLRPGERIESLHFVTFGEGRQMSLAPYILVITSRNRSLYFGPHSLLHTRAVRFSNFTNGSSHYVSGLFVDPTHDAKVYEQTLGVVLETKEVGGHQGHPTAILPMVQRIERYPDTTIVKRGAFLSKGYLGNVKKLSFQRIYHRWGGMRIDRMDGSIEILGRWDLSSPETIETVYHVEKGPLRAITFIMSNTLGGRNRQRHVEDIVVETSEDTPFNPATTPKLTFRWDKLNAEVAWWYIDHYDRLEYWSGTAEMVEMNTNNIPFIEVS